jgi:hypothetical protein
MLPLLVATATAKGPYSRSIPEGKHMCSTLYTTPFAAAEKRAALTAVQILVAKYLANRFWVSHVATLI